MLSDGHYVRDWHSPSLRTCPASLQSLHLQDGPAEVEQWTNADV